MIFQLYDSLGNTWSSSVWCWRHFSTVQEMT